MITPVFAILKRGNLNQRSLAKFIFIFSLVLAFVRYPMLFLNILCLVPCVFFPNVSSMCFAFMSCEKEGCVVKLKIHSKSRSETTKLRLAQLIVCCDRLAFSNKWSLIPFPFSLLLTRSFGCLTRRLSKG